MIKQTVKNIVYPLFKSRPDFLIIGAQKSGTTSLYNYLIQHPQIIKNKSWKEVRYFDLPENYAQGMTWYLGNFPSKLQKGNRMTVDSSPNYMYFPHIPNLIKQDLGNIKMIAVLREPVSRAYSAWKMYHSFWTNADVAQNNKKIADTRTFAEAIEQELNNKCAADIYTYDYLARGKYVEQIENYYQYFDKNMLLILNFNDLKNDLESVLNRVCTFLDIEPFSEASLKQLLENKYNVGIKSEKSVEDKQVLEQLKTYFEPYNQQLYTLLGKSYNW
ncbi:sulfotransferase domain-containing protein [Aphanothece sacrum]|uniref:Sulfotransferase n=1 Tax=Aphanothece sacrum FPU1 TaxID=1920663 RepID=A0A401IDG4_APHSA|nr:sulfotransferase domain-containing protein [Aphanothece sacrum]GBF79264.1 sulfotransferase [Aphanothece sacrum FPU1]GBF86766.1 sulfotransferase [Aphanothece sacrum FPU3]